MSARGKVFFVRTAVSAMMAAILALLIDGCKQRDTGEHTIVYNCAASTTEIAALQAERDTLRAQTGIDLRLNPFSGEQKLFAMIAAGQAPDVFYTNNAVRDRLASAGRLLDLRPLVAADPLWKRLRPDVRAAAVSADGGIYAIPNWTQTGGVYYDRAAFAAAGVSPPTADWTWADLRAAARRLTRPAEKGRPARYGIFIPAHFVEALEAMNHAEVGHDELFLRVPPESREAMAAYLALIRDGLMPDLRRVQAMGMQAAQLLQAGRVAMLVEAVPHPGLIETLTIDWAVAPLPRFDGKAPRYFRSASGGLSISADTKNPQDAWRALTWLIAEAAAYQPNPVLADVAFADGWEARYPQLRGRGFRETWELSAANPGGDPRYFVRFASWSMAPIMTRFQPWLDRLWAGDATLDEVAAAVPGINAAVHRDLERIARSGTLQPAWRALLERRLEEERARP